jgi:hypothetical protein
VSDPTPSKSPVKAVQPQKITSRERILNLLRAANGLWVLAPALSRCACAYARVVKECRDLGYTIENRVTIVDGQRHGSYRLLERPETSAAVEYWQGESEPEPEAAPGAARSAQQASGNEVKQPVLVELPEPPSRAWSDPELAAQKSRQA